MVETYIGIGSNLGDRRDLCARALGLLGMLPQSRLVGYSPAYETEPVGDAGGPFLNLVARVDTDLPAWRLLLISSEEHTPELQSLAYLVCRHRLETKNRHPHRDDHQAVARG